MKKKKIIILLVAVYIITILLYMLCIVACMKVAGDYSLSYLIWGAVGIILSWIFMPLIHECGHLLAGKMNGFKTVELQLYFWHFYKSGGNTVCKFVPKSEVMGACVMIPTRPGMLKKRFRAVTSGGLFLTGIVGVLPLLLLCLCGVIRGIYPAYSFFLMWLPACFFYTAFNAVPFDNSDGKSDGAVIYGLKNKCASEMLALDVLKIQAELYEGTQLADINKKFFEEESGTAETDPNFIAHMQLRYYMYLETGDTEAAENCINRLKEIYGEVNSSLKAGMLPDLILNATLTKDDGLKEYISNAAPLKARKDYTAYVIIACSLYNKGNTKKALDALRKAEDMLSYEELKGLEALRKTTLEQLRFAFR